MSFGLIPSGGLSRVGTCLRTCNVKENRSDRFYIDVVLFLVLKSFVNRFFVCYFSIIVIVF